MHTRVDTPSALHAHAAEVVCVHIKAAARAVGFCHSTRKAAAAYLTERGEITYDPVAHTCCCTTLADVLKPVLCRPLEGACSCHDHSLHGTCCHLLAAAQLPGLAGLPVLTGALLVDEEKADEVGCQAVGRRAWSMGVG